MAKREGPDPVEPVVVGGLRIEVPHMASDARTAHNGGFLVAYDAATGTRQWTVEVYGVRYDENRESDVQDVFITSVAVQDGKLRVFNEAGSEYLVDPQTRSVAQLS